MVVEATRGDLGEEDVGKPKVTEVDEDKQGKVDKLIIKKGKIFKGSFGKSRPAKPAKKAAPAKKA